MIDYVHRAINCITEQLSSQNNIWLLYGDEGLGKSTIAREFAITKKNAVLYKCNNEFELSYYVTAIFKTDNYNRYLNLYQPLIQKIKSEQIHTIIFDVEGNANADYFDLIYDFFHFMNQQNYQLNIVLFVDSSIYYRNQNIFAKYPQLVYLKPLKKWENTDFFQLWQELYQNSECNTAILERVASYSFGNAGVFIRHLNNLKFYNALALQGGKWRFSKGANIDELLRENFSDIVRKKYESLTPELQTIIKQTSTLGYIFKKKDLSEVFDVDNATIVLKQIEILTELLYFTDAKLENGKFDSIQVQEQIEKKIDSEKHREWCLALAQYYESKIQHCSRASTEMYTYKEKCILYYEKANDISKLIYHYVSLVPLLCRLNLYNSALNVSEKLREITEGYSEYKHFYDYSFYLLSQINKCLLNYTAAMDNLKKYMGHTGAGKHNSEINYLYAELLYGTGNTPEAYNLLKFLYKNIAIIDDPFLKYNIVSLLSSVEETMNNQRYIRHYNESLVLCTQYRMVSNYYKQLRKANLAHEGEHAILLMKKGEEYFQKCNDVIELIMIKHNIGTECLFYENTYRNAVTELKCAYNMACRYGFNQLSYIINSLAILDILEERYESAIEKLNKLMKIEQEDFTLLALYINKATSLLKLGMIDEVIELLDKASKINLKSKNQIPFFTSQIVLLKSYVYLAQYKQKGAYDKLCQYFNYGLLDRSTGILSAKIVLTSICNKYHYSYPAKLTSISDTCDAIALKMSYNHLVLCDLMFWE